MTRALHVSDTLKLPPDAVAQTLVVYGGKGMGKTNFGAVLAEELARARLRFAVIDPMGNWFGLRHSADGKGAGIEVLILGGRHGDLPIEPTAGAVVADLVADEFVNVIVDISRRADGKMWSRGERIRFVAEYCTRLYERQGEAMRPLMQIIDEAARYCPQLIPHGSPDLARCVGAIEQLVEEGRNVGVGITLLTQRSARLNKSVAELAECMIAFRTVGPNSVEAILDWLGDHVPKSSWKEKVEALRKLPRGTALVVSPGWLEYEGLAAIRHRSTFDTSATPTAGKERRASGPGATPDLAKYRARMAATIEKAKTEDPRELRREIASLKAELSKKQSVGSQSPGPKTVPDPQVVALARRLQKAVEQAMKFIVRINAEDFFKAAGESLDQAEVQKAIDQAAQSITKLLERKLDTRNQEIERLKREAGRIVLTLKSLLASDIALDFTVRHNEPFTVTTAPAPRRALAAGRPLKDGTTLAKGEFAVLTAVAQHGHQGVSREQLTILTGYKRSSRDTYLQRLGAQQLVEITGGGQIFATEAGLAALGPDFEPLPTGDALREYWLQRLTGGEQKILALLIKAHPKPLSRDMISEVTDYQRSSRDTYLQRLKARQLVLDEGRGAVKASPTLF
jgi:hypothetical protein